MSGAGDTGRSFRLLQVLRTFLAEQERLYERQALRNRPWEEDFLHWSRDGALHGHLAPPDDGRRRSVTADGWCPGWAQERQRFPSTGPS